MAEQDTSTNVEEFIKSLDGGVLQEKLAHILSDVAEGVITHGGKGKVQLTLNLKQFSDLSQVIVTHELAFTRPTKRGMAGETDTTETPFYVNRGGEMTLFPRKGKIPLIGSDDMGPIFEGQAEESEAGGE